MNNNITSLASTLQSAVSDVQSRLNTTQTQLASGKQILSKQEDSVVTRLSNQVNSQNRVQDNIDNANNVIAITQTALDSISTILINMKDLATQVSNGLYNATDQSNLSNAFANLNTQITNIASSANINGNNLLTDNQTLTVVSASDGINNQKTLVQGIDVAGLQSALNNLSFATSSIVELTKSAVQVGVLPISGINAEQDIQFNAMATGNTASVGGLTFTANSNLTAIEVAAIFAGKITSGTDPVAGIGSFNSTTFVGGYTAPASGTAIIKFTATVAGPNTLSVSGTVAPLTALAAGAVASTRTGVGYIADINAEQDIQFNAMATGNTASVGGLTFTANSNLTAIEVAAIFAGKITSGTDPVAGIGSFNSTTFVGGYTAPASGTAIIKFTATVAGPNTLSVSGTVAPLTALAAGAVASTRTGVTQVLTTNEVQTISFVSMANGDTVTAGGLAFTANTDLTETEVATIFANKISSGTNSAAGTFSNSFVGDYTVVNSGVGSVIFTAITAGAHSDLTASSATTNRNALSSANKTIHSAGGGTNASISVALQALQAGDTATIGDLSFQASKNVTPAQLSTIFASKIANSSFISPYGSFISSGSTVGSNWTVTGSGTGTLTLTGIDTAARSLNVSGRTINAALQTSDISRIQNGTAPVTAVNAYQTIQFYSLKAGESATLGGLTFTAAQDLTAGQVAYQFWGNVNKSPGINASEGTFVGSFDGSEPSTTFNFPYSYTRVGNGILDAYATSPGPKSLIFADGSVISGSGSTALRAEDVVSVTPGVNSSSGTYAQDTIQFHDLYSGQQISVKFKNSVDSTSTLQFTTNTFVSASALATLFAAKITTPNSTNSPTGGAFSTTGTNSGWGGVAGSDGLLTLTATTVGSKNYATSIDFFEVASASSSNIHSSSSLGITTQTSGVDPITGVLAQQTVSLYALNKGDSATIGGLI
uniref:flagellin N-terminal helical domain-containing protein n=1 Tax=Polynucleobacter sp. TaxID=2029855 RepID=UPI004047CD2F